ncbi:MAG: hypothetical protein H7301_04975 [Cryobacterium sp.]|nr:hypothetical protein [Oligoflexia bacterium]
MRKTSSWLAFFTVFLFVFLIGGRGLGYRTLWQDEVETAERAKSVAAVGVPRTIDPQGQWSVNTGGKEIEEGDLHRYTPWGQFYVGAAGIKLGELVGLDRDTAIRIPFFFLHAAASGMIAVSLPAVIAVSSVEAMGVAALYGFNSVRILHARTARYHAVTDFFFLWAWIFYGWFRRSARDRSKLRKNGLLLASLSVCIGILLFTHTLFGMLAFGLFSGLVFIEFPRLKRTYFFLLLNIALLGALSLLVRPWLQTAIWGELSFQLPFRSLRSWFHVSFSLFFFLATFPYFLGRRSEPRANDPTWKREVFLGAVYFLLILIGVRILDFQPFSQPRYYLPLIGACLFWPLAFGQSHWWKTREAGRAFLCSVCVMLVVVEFTGDPRPYQGVRLALWDAWMNHFEGAERKEQPMREAFALLKATAKPGDAVLMEYVPQLVNWYAPEFKPALVPDAATLSTLGRLNPRVASMPITAPDYHLYYSAGGFNAFWICVGYCDMSIRPDATDPNAYFVHSKALDRDFRFCMMKSWRTHLWNNAPYTNYGSEALTPEGRYASVLSLAKRCDLSKVNETVSQPTKIVPAN